MPDEILTDLLLVPYFAEAHDMDEISPERFIDLPGVQATGGSFAQAMQDIEDYCAARLGV